MEKIANRSLTKRLAFPLFPPLAIATCCLFAFITDNYKASLFVLFAAMAAHVVAAIIEEDGAMRIEDYASRADARMNVFPCKVCKNEPDVCYLEDGDCFYVRCQTCGIQTEFGDTANGVIDNWNSWKGKDPSEQ